MAVAGIGSDSHRHAIGTSEAGELALLGGLPRGAEAVQDDLVAFGIDEGVGVVAAVVGEQGAVVDARLVSAVDQIIVIRGVGVGDVDEGIGGAVVSLNQMRCVRIDPAVAVVAALVVFGFVGPSERSIGACAQYTLPAGRVVAPRACLSPREAKGVGMQVGFGDGDDAVGVADGGAGAERWGRRPYQRRLLLEAAGFVGAAAVAEISRIVHQNG